MHEHKFARLSDVALFCRCGEVKLVGVEPCTLNHYPQWTYYPTYPTYPTWTPTYWPITTSGSTTTVAFPKWTADGTTQGG